MPLEGHWQRINTPIRAEGARNARVVAVVVAVLAAAVIAVVAIGATQGQERYDVAPGCLNVVVPGVMGAERFHPCGDAASRACANAARHSDGGSGLILENCRERGIRF